MRNVVLFLIAMAVLSVLLTACEGGLTGKVAGYCRISLYEDKTCSECEHAGQCGVFCEDYCIFRGGESLRASGSMEASIRGDKSVVCDCECKVC
ncbi:MAG: hypothetical protein ABIE94_00715 [archaeon]